MASLSVMPSSFQSRGSVIISSRYARRIAIAAGVHWPITHAGGYERMHRSIYGGCNVQDIDTQCHGTGLAG